MVAMRAPPQKPPHVASRLIIGSLHEETETPCQDLIRTRPSTYLILDGHGPSGQEVATLAADALLSALSALATPPKPDPALLRAAISTAASVVARSPHAAASGATASLAVIAGKTAAVANVGDSSVVWARAGKHAELVSECHRPERPVERARVEKCGGVVQHGYLGDGRVGGKLIAVSRALGDMDVRAIGVVDVPYVTTVVAEGRDDFLILATDGLWDAHGGIGAQEAVDLVRGCFEDDLEDGGVGLACDVLVDFARGRARLPLDDLAVVVVRFGCA